MLFIKAHDYLTLIFMGIWMVETQSDHFRVLISQESGSSFSIKLDFREKESFLTHTPTSNDVFFVINLIMFSGNTDSWQKGNNLEI